MKRIIFSFKPEIFPALLTAEKRFEYRSRIPEGEVDAYIYLSSPVKKIVGKMHLGARLRILDIISESEEDARKRLERHLEEGAVYCSPILSLDIFDDPISLDTAQKVEPKFSPPQGYIYLDRLPYLYALLNTAGATRHYINPMKDMSGIGLYSTEIINKFPIRISSPDYL